MASHLCIVGLRTELWAPEATECEWAYDVEVRITRTCGFHTIVMIVGDARRDRCDTMCHYDKLNLTPPRWSLYIDTVSELQFHGFIGQLNRRFATDRECAIAEILFSSELGDSRRKLGCLKVKLRSVSIKRTSWKPVLGFRISYGV